MKIAVSKPSSMVEMFGPKYTEEFFMNLWKEHLLEKLNPEDEVTFIDTFSMGGKWDELYADYEAVIGIYIADDLFVDSFFEKHPNLRYAATTMHGFGRIDHDACVRHDFIATNTIYGDVTIAQFSMALLMECCHHLAYADDIYRNQKWLPENAGKRLRPKRQIELYQKTMGIIGLGNIGYWVAKMAAGFGMKIISYNHRPKVGDKYDFIEQVSLEELYQRSDVISINCPLTDETRGMIDEKAFSMMKDDVIIINTARGAIIDEKAFAAALRSGKVGAAGLDVLAGEPLKEPAELMEFPNVVVTEHIAAMPVEARMRSIILAAENFLNWRAGHPTSVVS